MKGSVFRLLFAGVVAVSSLGVIGCGPTTPKAKTANVVVGSMPSGESFKGVWYNPVWGELHLVQSGEGATGRWKSAQNGVWGKLTGTINGDVIKFEYEEHKTGAIGPGSVRKGKGYFKFIAPTEENRQPSMKGEWGVGENEVGGGEWDCQRLKDREPNLESVKGDEDPSMDSGWDTPAKK